MKKLIFILTLLITFTCQAQTLVKSEIVDTMKVSQWFVELTKLPIIFIKYKDEKVDFFVNGYKRGHKYCYYWNFVGYQMEGDKENYVIVRKETYKVLKKRIVRP